MNVWRRPLVMAAGMLLVSGAGAQGSAAVRAAGIRGVWGTYDHAPYAVMKSGTSEERRMEIDKLLDDLVDLHVNTYVFLIWHSATDWVELHRFLPEARKRGINVWVYLCPPSEQPPIYTGYTYCEPFRLDFARWGREIARLSLEEPNLTAWCIDDFPVAGNLKVFTPVHLKEIVEGARKINPKLAFLPCLYDMTGKQGAAVKPYKGLFDGILLCHEKQDNNMPMAEHRAWMEKNIAICRQFYGKSIPVVSFHFTTRWNNKGVSPPQLTHDLLMLSRELADGCLCYLHPAPDASNRQTIKDTFEEFSRTKAWGREGAR